MLFKRKIKASKIVWNEREEIKKQLKIHRNKLKIGEVKDYPDFLATEILLITKEQQLWKLYFTLIRNGL